MLEGQKKGVLAWLFGCFYSRPLLEGQGVGCQEERVIWISLN